MSPLKGLGLEGLARSIEGCASRVRNGARGYADYYKGLHKNCLEAPFPHSLPSTGLSMGTMAALLLPSCLLLKKRKEHKLRNRMHPKQCNIE